MNKRKEILLLQKSYFLLLLLFLASSAVNSQNKMEQLDRGLVAVPLEDGNVFLSWRTFQSDSPETSFDIYRGEKKINEAPITASTNFTDSTNLHKSEPYFIYTTDSGQVEKSSRPVHVWKKPHMNIPLQRPTGGTTPDGVAYEYTANDCSVGDLDGDGEYEIILKWNPSNAKDNSQKGYTGPVFIDAYRMNGKHLWRIDLGKNIRAGAHYTQFIVYDFDSDGKAEIAMKTADGTRDGAGKTLGDGQADYRNSSGYILSGPEYLTIFNGETGKAMATTDYLPARGNVCDWGDCYGNRVDRFLAGVAYLDGKNPSLIMSRGYYTRSVLAAWDWRNGKLSHRWIFDTDEKGNEKFAGQGNHQLSVGDVDEDGKDEILFGAMAVDDDGTKLHTTGLGHGDAMHLSDLDPERPGMELFQIHEPSNTPGASFRDAHTGELIWTTQNADVGRGISIDVDPRYHGTESWGFGKMFNTKGKTVSTKAPYANFGIWWDGDLLRELLNGSRVDKWDHTQGQLQMIHDFSKNGAAAINGTKSNPNLSADIFGDWREEVILRRDNNEELMIFTTTIPSNHKIPALMQDRQYRISVSWQNVGYNQPPHTSFFLGEGMVDPIREKAAMNE